MGTRYPGILIEISENLPRWGKLQKSTDETNGSKCDLEL